MSKDWNAEDFLSTLRIAYRNKSERRYKLREIVWQDTLQKIKNGKYISERGQETDLSAILTKDIAERTIFVEKEIKTEATERFAATKIKVVNDDCLNVAHKLISEGKKPCVLNMANRQMPGGGVRSGSGAQEESICRRSDYYRSIFTFHEIGTEFGLKVNTEHSYPMDRTYGGIYTPDVTVFRSDERTGYALLDQPYKVSLVAVAAINNPSLEEGRMNAVLEEATKNKMRTILRLAYNNGHKTLVLGALGCGAFNNPPEQIADLFKQVLNEDEFKNIFEEIIFAILTRNMYTEDKGNYSIFKKAFEGDCDATK